MLKKLFIIFPVFLLSVIFPACALDSVDVFSGYLEADLDRKDDYQAIPLLVGFNFSALPVLERIGLDAPWRTDFIVEPFINTVISPDKNIEVGSNFLIKFTFPVTEKIHPYIKGGVGALYMSQHTKEQSTQYNFLPQGGGGFQYFLNDKTALGFEYRYRHLSNASIKSPNSGIDAHLFLTGVSFFFE